MRWYDWRLWRLASAPRLRSTTVREANITWKHLGAGFYWATKA